MAEKFTMTRMFPGFGGAAPDGLYVVRNGIAVAVMAEFLAKREVLADGHAWESINDREKFKEVSDAQTAIDQLVAALTRPADGAAS